ncbi:hypothetical protein [Caulobacter phage Cr30]|uniref:hypothetical protein n=1 Tax=Caulobacter phage Cr30 TaxID=1357714 RepID=UPI0004A9B5B5|nr:hypothetical protein OZ74_gp281 [Caulobacter phage Cr30]AGS81062.1 hypothetical protein [Caulobacter phage Cr30]
MFEFIAILSFLLFIFLCLSHNIKLGKYRIRQLNDSFYPQYFTIVGWRDFIDCYGRVNYSSLEAARKFLDDKLVRDPPVVETIHDYP